MRAKLISYSGWAFVMAAGLYFIYANAIHYFSYNLDSYGEGFFPAYAPSLLIHVSFGIIALLLGPLQFRAAFRKKYPTIHRNMGKAYLVSILIASMASLNLSINKMIITEHITTFGTGLIGLAIAWISTSAMAFWAARSKNFVQHREWMVKSYVVTFAFVTFRLVEKLLLVGFDMKGLEVANILAWSCWSIPLLVTEMILQGQKINRGNAARAGKA